MLKLLAASDNFDVDARRDYAAYYHDRNVWFRGALRHAPPYVARGEELIEDADFQRTEFCADWCSRVGIYHMIGCMFPITTTLVGGSGIHRTRRQGPFTDEEKRLYGIIISHLSRALQIADRFGMVQRSEALTLDVIERLQVGVLLLAADCRVMFANAVADRLLRDGHWLTCAAGIVRPAHEGSVASFARRVRVAATTAAGVGIGTGGIVRLRDPIGRALPLLVAPFRSLRLGLDQARPTAVVVVSDPGARRRAQEEAIAALYGLSPAEGRLVALLAGGRSLVDSAARAGISLNTAKTQLASVFAKTGFSRQADLIADVLGHAVLRVTTWPDRGARR